MSDQPSPSPVVYFDFVCVQNDAQLTSVVLHVSQHFDRECDRITAIRAISVGLA